MVTRCSSLFIFVSILCVIDFSTFEPLASTVIFRCIQVLIRHLEVLLQEP